MGEQLSMLDTMFLELEDADDTAHMHIGAALIFEALPGAGSVARWTWASRSKFAAASQVSQLSAPACGPESCWPKRGR